jgi:hypothetical protein
MTKAFIGLNEKNYRTFKTAIVYKIYLKYVVRIEKWVSMPSGFNQNHGLAVTFGENPQ